MSEFASTAALVILFRLVTVLSGLAVVYLGYMLFKIGVFAEPTEIDAKWGDKNLLLKQAAPGTCFALFGAAVIITSIWRGVTFDRSILGSQKAPGGSSNISDGSGSGVTDRIEVGIAGYAKVPDDIKDIIEKVTKKEELTEEQIKALQDFRDEIDRFSIQAWQDPNKIQGPSGFEGLRDAPGLFQG